MAEESSSKSTLVYAEWERTSIVSRVQSFANDYGRDDDEEDDQKRGHLCSAHSARAFLGEAKGAGGALRAGVERAHRPAHLPDRLALSLSLHSVVGVLAGLPAAAGGVSEVRRRIQSGRFFASE